MPLVYGDVIQNSGAEMPFRVVFRHQDGTVLSEWAHWAGQQVNEWPTTEAQAAGLGRKVQDENAALAAKL